MSRKIIFAFSLLFLFAILINSCKSTKAVANKITIESGEIPPDMRNEKFTVIGVLHGKDSYDKYVEKEFSEYTGKYVLATYPEIKAKYTDSLKYRYIMDCFEIVTESYDAKSLSKRRYSVGYRYFITDRKTDVTYKRKQKSGFFALEMKAYLKAIEAVRK